MTESHKIATSIDNMIKKLANTYKLWTEPTECTVKLLVNTYSYKKHLLLSGLKLLREERNISIFLSFIGKIQRHWLYKECKVAYKTEDEI